MEKAVARLRASTSQMSDVAYGTIKRSIIECEFEPGSFISEPMLVSKFDLGKAAVRTALTRLSQEGLVEPIRRQGYRVAPITLQDVREIFQLRMLVEPEIARLAAGRLNDEQITALQSVCKTSDGEGAEKSDAEFLAANREFHLLLADAAGNLRLKDLLRKLLDDVERMLFLGLVSEPLSEHFQQEHMELLRALIAGRGLAAAEMVREQLQGGLDMVVKTTLSGGKVEIS